MKKIPPVKELRKICRPKPTRVWISRRFTKLSIYITKLVLYTPITANQITILTILLGIVGGAFLSIGKLWSFVVGALFFSFCSIFDLVDGEVARYRKNTTLRGKYLEEFSPHIIDLSLDIGLVLGSGIFWMGYFMILLNFLIKMSVGCGQRVFKTPKFLLNPHGIGWEIAMIVFDFSYTIYWSVICVTLDSFFGTQFLKIFIIIQVIARFFKFVSIQYIFSKANE